MYYVYMLRCKGGSLYTGYTDDLERRYSLHAAGKGARYTKSRPPLGVAAAWETAQKSDAMRLEYRIKRLTKAKKELLLADPLGAPYRKVR